MLWLVLVACGQAPAPERQAALEGPATSIAVETSVIPIRATEAIRRRFELVASLEHCTGAFCKQVPAATFATAAEAAVPALGLAVEAQRSSPHAPTTRLVVSDGATSCELHDGREERVVDRATLEAVDERLRAIWLAAPPVE